MKSTAPVGPPGDDPAVLSIGEVSQRTGIPVAGLRNWEQRHGLPRPERLPNGRRRYRESDCVLLAEVLRGRAQGLSLSAAVAHALASTATFRQTSIFAGLRERYPALRVHVITKTTLLALTHAIEDECCARAQRPVLVGCFQQVRFYQAARPRWADLARTAEQTVVFADFGQRREQPGPLAEIPNRRRLPAAPRVDADLRRARSAGLRGGLGTSRPGRPPGPGPHLRDALVGRPPGGPQRRAHRGRAGRRGGLHDSRPAAGPARRGGQPQLARSAPASGVLERTFNYLSRLP